VGELDILVNNAGAIRGGNLLAVDDATLRAGPQSVGEPGCLAAGRYASAAHDHPPEHASS
jgi:hypothetical protein